MFWYADFPDHYAGDATTATPEKGQFLLDHYAEQVALILRAIKADNETGRLMSEYYNHTRH